MQEAIPQPTSSLEAADPIVAAALRAEAWAGEPFLRDGEDPAQALAEGTARRRALDEACAELDAGRTAPSTQWKVRYGLLLGLERVLAEPEPRTAAGTALRRHQVDALAARIHGEVEGGGELVYEVEPANPFRIFGGMGI